MVIGAMAFDTDSSTAVGDDVRQFERYLAAESDAKRCESAREMGTDAVTRSAI